MTEWQDNDLTLPVTVRPGAAPLRAPSEPRPVLEAATRLVDASRLNPLQPHEITPRHLARASQALRQAGRELTHARDLAAAISQRCRVEAQRGQRLARTNPGRRRAFRVQTAIRRARDLRATYDALQAERGRLARQIAAARQLDDAWEALHPGRRGRGRGAATRLRRALLTADRAERLTRDQLEEAERALHHVAAAEGAMLRDSGALRLDPITFTRFAGRRRWSVLIGLAIVSLALVAAFLPPWDLPRATIRCQDGAGTAIGCAAVRTGGSVRLANSGDGVLVGWVDTSGTMGATRVSAWLPFAILPGHDRRFTCAELNDCALAAGDAIVVSVVSSGGGGSLTILP